MRQPCRSGKNRYRDALDAKIALANTFRSKGKKRQEVAFYRCPMCAGFHLTKRARR